MRKNNLKLTFSNKVIKSSQKQSGNRMYSTMYYLFFQLEYLLLMETEYSNAKHNDFDL